MNAKGKGSRNERKSMALLESLGYSVTKSGASLGVFDLVGISRTDIVLVQCKSNRRPSPEERETILLFPAPPNCRKLIHVWKDHARTPQIEEVG